MGVAFAFGHEGVEKQSRLEAIKWLRVAAENGHAEAMNNLAANLMGDMVSGVEYNEDDAEAADWFLQR